MFLFDRNSRLVPSISVFGSSNRSCIPHSRHFGRIICPFSMTEAQFPLHSKTPVTHKGSRGLFISINREFTSYSSSGCWPSWAFQAHSVIFISVNTAVKEDSSGEQA